MASLLAVGQPPVDSTAHALFKKDTAKYVDSPRASLMGNNSNSNNAVKKYRAIAPRPIAPLVEVPSPSSSVDNSSQPTSPVTVVKEKKGRKRVSASSASAEKRFVRDSKTLRQACCKNFLNFGAVDKLSALDGTPLGKLLRSTPDIQVPASLSFDSSAANSRPFPSKYSPPNAFDARSAPGVGSPEDASSRPEPVTLSLLPETPANSSIRRNGNSGGSPDLAKRSPSDGSRRSMPAETRATDSGPIHSGPGSQPVVDSKFMDSVYGGLMCPALLTEESGEVLWFNLALQQLMKDSASFHSLTMASPLPVSRVNFFSALKGRFSNAILWIVDKKESSVEAGTQFQSTLSHLSQRPGDPQVADMGHPPSALGSQLSGNAAPTDAGSPDLSLGSSLPAPGSSKVIRPSPVRLVKSVVQLQEVCPLEQFIGPIKGSFDMMKNQADQWNIPVLLTGLDFKVKWVNSCYKSIVSENESVCPADSPSSKPPLDGANRLLNGMIGNVEIQGMDPPSSHSAISSIVTIEWHKDCEDRSRKFAALAIKLEDMASQHIGYLWCFHKIPFLNP